MITKIKSSFRLRLTFMVLLAIIIPLIVTLSFVAISGFQIIENSAKSDLAIRANALTNAVESWDNGARLAIRNLSQQPGIISMNAFSQRATLRSMTDVYTDMYLIHTVDLTGENVARSDFGASLNYSDRDWFKGSMAGNDVTLQTLVGRTTGAPSLAYSSPIRNKAGEIVGATLAVSTLDTLADSVGAIKLGNTGFGYLVDENGIVLAHPDPAFTTGELVNLSALPPVASVLAGQQGHFEYQDENGVDWFTHLVPLDNGWGIVIQQEKAEAMAALPQFITMSTTISILVLIIIGLLTWWVAGRAIRPVITLTNAATAVAAGNLNEVVEIKQTDEIGTLTAAFNSMTEQLRSLVGNLEQRVSARTRDLALANEVGRTVSEIRDANQLLSDAVKIIRDDFDLYLAQIYLVEDDQETLMLRAAEGQAADRLLSQGHFLMINTTSINGTAVSEKRAVVVSDTEQDLYFRPNPLLPNTRSEMSVPLLVADSVIGALDIQSTIPNAFTEENVPAFTAMAGQLAIALQNASLFSEREQTAAELETVLSDTARQAERLTQLNMLGTKLASASRLNDVYQIISSQILTLIAGDRASIALVTAAGKSAEVLALQGEDGALATGTTLPFAGTAVGLAIQENRVIHLPKESPMSTYSDSRQLAQQGLQSTIITPLSATGHVIGTLNIGSVNPYAFSAADISLVQQAAALLASTIDSMNLVDRVQSLASIVENHPDFIGIGSLTGDAIYANPAGLALLGLPADYDLTGVSALDFYSEKDAERFMQEGLPAALETGSWTAEMQLRRADGSIVPVEQTIAINYDADNKASNFSITMRDITKRQEDEESRRQLTTRLEERLLQVNALQRAMTHEGWAAFLTSDNRLVQGFKYDNEQVSLISSRDVQKGMVPTLSETSEANSLSATSGTVATPVDIRGETIGVIGARNPNGTPLTESQMAVLKAMSQQVASALDRARLFEEMEIA
ncbi:MAG: GAF domain-containing protein, partial [Anaerolineae bacterium]|nr:GAF domain-containing protein [Anaerolineae bacterium]